jgi:hypothetical protein
MKFGMPDATVRPSKELISIAQEAPSNDHNNHHKEDLVVVVQSTNTGIGCSAFATSV